MFKAQNDKEVACKQPVTWQLLPINNEKACLIKQVAQDNIVAPTNVGSHYIAGMVPFSSALLFVKSLVEIFVRHNVVSLNVVSCNVISLNVVSRNVISCNVVSLNVISLNGVSHNVVNCNVVNCNVVSLNVIGRDYFSALKM